MRRLQPVPVPEGLWRFGPHGDGGYLMPNDLDGVVGCLSPGVSFECGFDTAIAERGIDVFMADASVAGPAQPHPALCRPETRAWDFEASLPRTFVATGREAAVI